MVNPHERLQPSDTRPHRFAGTRDNVVDAPLRDRARIDLDHSIIELKKQFPQSNGYYATADVERMGFRGIEAGLELYTRSGFGSGRI